MAQTTTRMDALLTPTERTREIGLPTAVKAVLTPLASLKLTVFLLAASVLVTWIATLDQASIDIWELKRKHFESWRVYVPFQTFFVPAWFPEFQSVPFGFWIPSGMTLIVAMLVNLTSAHLLRFRLQAQGVRLLAGLAVGLLAGLFTWAIIFSGSDQRGFQAQPPISYRAMWSWMQVGILGLSLAAIASAVWLPWDRRIEKSLFGFGGFLGLALLAVVFTLGDDAFIGDSAMRILWQLLLSTLAATVGLVSSLLLFRRKAGIVLLHLGIAGLLLNEIYVTVTNTEQQMLIAEGQTSSVAVDIRHPELAVIDRSDPEMDRIVSVPGSRLQAIAGTTERITDPELPFEIEVESYFTNSDFRASDPDPNSDVKGIGQTFRLFELPPIPGTDTDRRDFAGAYVRLYSRDGKPLGKYLLSQLIYLNDYVDSIDVDGREFQIGLRDKEIYKPYSITLNDVQREDYIGTSTPKWFASEIEFHDHLANQKSDQRIWMNNPMRYAGETFYQQSYVPADDKTGERTVLQIVKNRGWMIPYVCCMFTVVGLAYQFGTSLLAYLRRQQQPVRREKILSVSTEPPPSSWTEWIPTVILVGAMGIYCVGQFSRSSRPAADSQMRLDLFGQVPVTYEGRVKPLDSVARNLARQLCNRETVVYRANITRPRMFGLIQSPEKKSAMEWFADTIFRVEGYEDDYEIFRVEDPTVRNALKLPDRKSMDYTLTELRRAEPKIREILDGLGDRQPAQFSNYEKRVVEISRKLNRITEMQAAFMDPATDPEDRILNRLQRARLLAQATELPRSFPTADPQRPWEVFATARNRQWLSELAEEYQLTNPARLAPRLVDVDVINELREEMIREAIPAELIRQGRKKSEVDQMLAENGGQLPDSVVAEMRPLVAPRVDDQINSRRIRADAATFGQIRDVIGSEVTDLSEVKLEHPELADLFGQLGPAYRNRETGAFNDAIAAYLTGVAEAGPTGYRPSLVKLEFLYNGFAPFYLSMVLYLVALLIGMLSWVGYSVPLNRAAFWLVVLGLLLQISGLVMRVVISGRPPITNLYSSFLFVSAFAVLIKLFIERFTRIGIGTVLGSTAGFLALLTAWSISVREGDTFTVLRAVLDTQFWLSTHVICIAMGYSATVAAGFLGIAYVLGGLFTRRFDDETSRKLGNMIYGIVCFALLFSFFGTVLGGLWADDSWGRFWGWDPKENGALMIVLWNAVVLHARWAGLVKLRGVAVLAIVGNIVTVWSWEAVNQLGIGLHAYGFSEGRMKYVAIFWLVNLGLVLIGLIPLKFWRSSAVAGPTAKG